MVAGLNFVHFLSIFIMSIAAASDSPVAAPPVKAAYWPAWAEESFPPSAIDTTLFTHIYYAFLMPDNVTHKFDISDSTEIFLSNFTSTLHQKNPPVKTLFSIGGGDSNMDLFAAIASSKESRQIFISSAIEVARKFGFDGIDLDWEVPQSPKDMDNLGLLFDDWRAELDKEAQSTGRPTLLLTAAVFFAVDFNFYIGEVYRKYPVTSISKNLDWINAMCYDYSGSWGTSITGVHAALYNPNSNMSTSYGLNSWVKAGVPGKKVVMGLPLYGRTWQLKDPKLTGIGAPAVGVGPGDEGTLTFSQVENFNRENKATVVYDADVVAVHSFAGTSWIGYDDPRSTTDKIKFAQALGLRGYFFWAVNGDDKWKISTQASSVWIS